MLARPSLCMTGEGWFLQSRPGGFFIEYSFFYLSIFNIPQNAKICIDKQGQY